MNILALDLATKCGWAVGSEPGKLDYGTEDFQNKKWDGAGMRFLKFNNFLRSTIIKYEVDLAVVEGVMAHSVSATAAQHLYGGWLAEFQLVCERMKIPYTAKGVTELKKFWTGKGSAKKDKMIERAFELGYAPQDDNAADAIALWHMMHDSVQID